MRPVDRGDPPTDNNGDVIVFQQYGDARNPLVERIGDYLLAELAETSDNDEQPK